MRRSHGDACEGSRRKQGAWRTASLCAQARRAIEIALCGLADPRLDALVVEDVVPAPSARRLLVLLRRWDGESSERDETEIRGALAGVEGLLRSEVADAITRKRTPELAFVLLCSDETLEPDRAGCGGDDV